MKFGWKETKIIQALKTVYGDHAPKKTCVYKWMEQFRNGREAVEDDEDRGRPTTPKNVDFLGAWLKKMEDCQFLRYLRLQTYQLAQLIQFYSRI